MPSRLGSGAPRRAASCAVLVAVILGAPLLGCRSTGDSDPGDAPVKPETAKPGESTSRDRAAESDHGTSKPDAQQEKGTTTKAGGAERAVQTGNATPQRPKRKKHARKDKHGNDGPTPESTPPATTPDDNAGLGNNGGG